MLVYLPANSVPIIPISRCYRFPPDPATPSPPSPISLPRPLLGTDVHRLSQCSRRPHEREQLVAERELVLQRLDATSLGRPSAASARPLLAHLPPPRLLATVPSLARGRAPEVVLTRHGALGSSQAEPLRPSRVHHRTRAHIPRPLRVPRCPPHRLCPPLQEDSQEWCRRLSGRVVPIGICDVSVFIH